LWAVELRRRRGSAIAVIAGLSGTRDGAHGTVAVDPANAVPVNEIEEAVRIQRNRKGVVEIGLRGRLPIRAVAGNTGAGHCHDRRRRRRRGAGITGEQHDKRCGDRDRDDRRRCDEVSATSARADVRMPTLVPRDAEEPYLARYSLEWASSEVDESIVRSADHIADRAAHEHLPCARLGADACTDVYRDATQLGACGLHLAQVEARPDLEALGPDLGGEDASAGDWACRDRKSA